ncbi:MAG: diaminopimelate decarboxylase [Thermotogota bacterium]|nr:diaminopimelate decarboxylase [Thermotogota bacterium]
MIDFKSLADEFGTPLYVYSAEKIREACSVVKGTFEGFEILPTFAVKANNNPVLLRVIREEGFGADVVSTGELKAALIAKIPPDRIVWNGNGKTPSEVSDFIRVGVGYINVDSVEEMEMWLKIENSSLPRLLLRVNPDVDARTHPKISTGLKFHKFGIPLEQIQSLPSGILSRIKGLHVHIGSQILDPEVFADAFRPVVRLCNDLGLEFLNIGGGWGIPYRPQDKAFDLEKYRNSVLPILKEFKGKIILELGRYIIGPAGFLLLRVTYVKRTPHKTFVVVDGGMNVLMRPALYNAYHEVKVLSPSIKDRTQVDVVGPLCESGDVIALDRELPIPEPGTLLLVENVGAYGYSMSNNYNSATRPAEVLLENGVARLIRRRESVDDLFSHVVMYE